MELNPYAKYLGGDDPVAVLEGTTVRMGRVFDAMREEQIKLRPASGKWSVREIVAHMADCELVFAFRLRQTLAEDRPVMQPFDQDRWAARYANHDFDAARRMFEAARNWNLLLIRETTEAERARVTSHPERGTMTFWTIVETMAGHDINHLQQMERLVGKA